VYINRWDKESDMVKRSVCRRAEGNQQSQI